MTPTLREPVHILHLDDSPDDAQLIGMILENAHDELPAMVTYVRDKREYLDALARKDFHIILSDWRMPAYTGDDALADARRLCPEIPFIMVTGEMGEDRAIETLHRGATDYVLKGNMLRLVPAICRALTEAEQRRERARAEGEARLAQQQTEEILASIEDPFFHLDSQWRFTYVNANAEAHYGKAQSELLGRSLWDALPATLGTESEWQLRRAMDTRRAAVFVTRSLVHDIWVETHLAPSADGGLSVMCRNITERLQAEESLKRANEGLDQRNRELDAERTKWQNLIGGIADEVWVCDPDGTVDLVNLSTTLPMGFPELQGKPLGEVLEEVEVLSLSGYPRPPEAAPLLRALRGEIVRGVELVRHRKSGRIRFRQHSAAPMHDGRGNVTGSVAVVRDITEAIQAERALRKSQEQLQMANQDLVRRYRELEAERIKWQHLVRGIADEVWSCDAEGKMSLMNLVSDTAMQLEEFKGKTVEEVYREVDILRMDGTLRPAEEAPLLRSLQGDLVRGEEIMRHKTTGRVRYRQYSAAPVRDADGGIIGAVAIVRDITEAKEAEREVTELNAELEERVRARTAELERINQELEAFSYSVSHDLRAPLRIINGFAGLLTTRAAVQLSEKDHAALATIKEQALKMDDLIKALLEFSHLLRSEQLKLVPVDTRRMVEEVVEEQRLVLGDISGKRVFVELGALPVVKADPILLRMVFTNLVSNAFKFTRPVAEPKVEIGARAENGVYTFRIADNGVGFPKGQAEKLFRVFQRLHGVGQFEGTGIGLANVRKIVERHGGQVCGDGEEGRGAAFFFTLPQQVEAQEDLGSLGRISAA